MANDSRNNKATMKELWHKMDGLYDSYAKSIGINFTTIIVLQHLWESSKNLTQKEVCEMLELPKQLVNAIIKSFWEQGFVILKETKDRRIKDIILTGKGKDYATKILKPLEDAESAVWDSFTADEVIALLKGFEKYALVFEGILKKGKFV